MESNKPLPSLIKQNTDKPPVRGSIEHTVLPTSRMGTSGAIPRYSEILEKSVPFGFGNKKEDVVADLLKDIFFLPKTSIPKTTIKT